jgi:hypothetical protein
VAEEYSGFGGRDTPARDTTGRPDRHGRVTPGRRRSSAAPRRPRGGFTAPTSAFRPKPGDIRATTSPRQRRRGGSPAPTSAWSPSSGERRDATAAQRPTFTQFAPPRPGGPQKTPPMRPPTRRRPPASPGGARANPGWPGLSGRSIEPISPICRATSPRRATAPHSTAVATSIASSPTIPRRLGASAFGLLPRRGGGGSGGPATTRARLHPSAARR